MTKSITSAYFPATWRSYSRGSWIIRWTGIISSMTMEYYGYATLAEVFVYENLDPGSGIASSRTCSRIITSAFMKYRQPLEVGRDARHVSGKMARRLRGLKGSPELEMLKESALAPFGLTAEICPSLVNGLAPR